MKISKIEFSYSEEHSTRCTGIPWQNSIDKIIGG